MNRLRRPVHIYFRQEICAVPPWCPYKLCHESADAHTCGPLGIDEIVVGGQNGQVVVLLHSMSCWPVTIRCTTTR